MAGYLADGAALVAKEAELAKAFLYQQARTAALVLDSRSDDEVVALLDEAVGLPKKDVSMQLPLPGLLSPALERLRAAVADDDPDEVAAAVPAVLAEVDTPIVRAGLVRAVLALRDAGRVSDAVAAAVVVEQASRSTTLLRASLLEVMRLDYVTTARAKGVVERGVVLRFGVAQPPGDHIGRGLPAAGGRHAGAEAGLRQRRVAPQQA